MAIEEKCFWQYCQAQYIVYNKMLKNSVQGRLMTTALENIARIEKRCLEHCFTSVTVANIDKA
jgi:hypothetical protein